MSNPETTAREVAERLWESVDGQGHGMFLKRATPIIEKALVAARKNALAEYMAGCRIVPANQLRPDDPVLVAERAAPGAE